MANKTECDRCGKQATASGNELPSEWDKLRIGEGIASSTRDLCGSCVSAFWEWFHVKKVVR